MPESESNDVDIAPLVIPGLDRQANEKLQGSIREFHEAHPDIDISEVAGFAARILGQNQESDESPRTENNNPERQKAIETLLNPKIFNELDYWDGRHGVKCEIGRRPEGTFSDAPPSTIWFETMTSPPVDLKQAHQGKGATIAIRGEHNTVYVLHFQVSSGEGSRPDVYSVTRVPNSKEFKQLQQQLDADGSILLDAFSTLYPEVREPHKPIGVELKNKAPIQLGIADVKVQFKLFPNSLRNL